MIGDRLIICCRQHDVFQIFFFFYITSFRLLWLEPTEKEQSKVWYSSLVETWRTNGLEILPLLFFFWSEFIGFILWSIIQYNMCIGILIIHTHLLIVFVMFNHFLNEHTVGLLSIFSFLLFCSYDYSGYGASTGKVNLLKKNEKRKKLLLICKSNIALL